MNLTLHFLIHEDFTKNALLGTERKISFKLENPKVTKLLKPDTELM